MRVLNPYQLPLTESALIEASAGTGKTFTITTLYLRAILGLRDDSKTLKPLTVSEILVVTFTEAATQEIKDRVRAKLVAMQKFIVEFSASSEVLEGDPSYVILKDYIDCSKQAGLTVKQALEKAYEVISAALILIDEASIYTIHGFCNRSLTRFAFESKISFEQSFEMDDSEYVTSAVYDFWRKNISVLTGMELNWFRQYWKSPQALLQSVRPLINRKISLAPSTNEKQLSELFANYQNLLKKIKADWLTSDFTGVLQNSALKKNIKTVKRLPLVEAFLQSNELELQFGKGEDWSLFGSEVLGNSKNYKAKASLIEHPLINDIDLLQLAYEKLHAGAVKAYWLEQTKHYVEQRSQQLKTEKSILTPDDLLLKLHGALEDDQAFKLADQIRMAHPLAMVDEFQDTDAIQYAIFEQLYLSEQATDADLLMIGDPKQAIYKFRGADIFTYIAAKQALKQDNLYTLDTNWRSHPNLVACINGLFAESHTQFDHKLIPFQKVKSGLSTTKALIEENKLQCLDINLLLKEQQEKTIKPADAEGSLAQLCASQIKQTLIHSEQGEANIVNGEEARLVQAGDICVLVRTRRQASLVKRELAKIGVASVFISRENIFNTPIAGDFLRLLKAIHEPQNEVKVRAALTTAFFNLSLTQLESLFQSSEKWHALYNLFYVSHEHWLAGRTALAVQKLLDQDGALGKWLTADDKDTNRLATDFRHLVELLQLKSKEIVGREKLITWFSQQVEQTATDGSAEANQIRLESDSNLVQIATLHASKGLEYPVVYLPFICEFRAAKDALYNSEQSGLMYRVDNREIELQRAEKERLAEDIRLLYVALTRPVYKLVLSVFNLQDRFGRNELNKTALSHLFNLSDVQTDEALQASLESTVEKLNGDGGTARLNAFRPSEIISFKHAMQSYQLASTAAEPELSLPNLQRKISRQWQMWSYSSLVHYLSAQSHDDFGVEVVGSTDEVHINLDVQELEIKSRFTFPKGANAGTCLHELFENLDFTQRVGEQVEVIESTLNRYGYDTQWTNTVIDWCQDVLNQPIGGFRLNQLTDMNKLVEMEFYFVVENMDMTAFGNALSMMGIDVNLSAVNEIAPKGIIKGFVDLIYEHNGKYYVLDYKSNYLGPDSESYNESNMHLVMTDHNYYLQSLIYVLALHRYLSNAVQDYCYDQYIGGAVYLFLRGCDGGTTANGVKAFEIKEEIVNYLDNALLNCGQNDNSAATKPDSPEREQNSLEREQNSLERKQNSPEQTTGSPEPTTESGVQNDFGF